jgi:protein O-mannosyl-transferase
MPSICPAPAAATKPDYMSFRGALMGALFFRAEARSSLLTTGGLAAIVALLYAPFLSNPLFFDDRGLFSGLRFAEFATTPFGWGLRYPSYFTIAAVQVVFGTVQAQRALNLVLHCAAALALFFALRSLQRLCLSAPETPARGRIAAMVAAALFAAHPVAVYAAGYLVQRSILLATLFSLVSLAVFVRGAVTMSTRAAVAAGVFYALAVLSKEHALLAAALGPLAIWAHGTPRRALYRYICTYWAICAPVAILVVLFGQGIIGQRYEPDFAEVAAQISPSEAGWVGAPWVGSALAQAALFFRYLWLWLWPRTDAMALDLRVDFATLWQPSAALAALLAFIACGAVCASLVIRRKGAAALVAFGMLWFWLLYLVEFSTIRFQEPFVLYRSYLWAPGVAIAAAALLARLPVRAALATSVCALLVLGVQAHDRLGSFSSGVAIWEDAVAKLPPRPVPGAPRTLYQLGREYLNSGQADRAVAVIERCLREYPQAFHCVFARAAIHLRLEEYEAAIPYLRQALALRPEEGIAAHHLGLALQQLGCPDQARAQYEAAYKLGFLGAVHRIKAMDAPGEGLLPPAAAKAPATTFRCPA